MTQAIRLMIADDHAIMREGLKQIFLLDDGIKVVGEAADGGRGAGTAARRRRGSAAAGYLYARHQR